VLMLEIRVQLWLSRALKATRHFLFQPIINPLWKERNRELYKLGEELIFKKVLISLIDF